ncbi:hypothetical protein N2599_21215 (plasmid) [Rhizobium sullae]|uniref:Sarcosine oxidase subunit gamma n=1 Tax=Rhizobium sullae TaxID=50338 RepID=A0ABY5XTL7_RHISU|nr:hypothetical protein [Rhizobium sullae]UWU17845.1 hypothetical protein N2599_21215 [Rhizobium sullae]
MVEIHSSEPMVLKQSPCPLIQYEAWDLELRSFEAALAQKIDGPVPGRVGEIAVRDDLKVVRAAPRRFWLFPAARGAGAFSIPPELGYGLDLSEGRVRIQVITPHLRDLLSTCLPIDWDTTEGVATFSSFHRIPIMFTRSSDFEGEFIVPRSFARSISHWLCSRPVGTALQSSSPATLRFAQP